MKNHLTPVMHSTLMDSVRVPMWESDDGYSICVGDNNYRHFTEETLPNRVKAILAMIKAFPVNDRDELGYSLILNAYENNQDRRLDDVGWRVTKGIYMLVLERQIFDAIIRGDHGKHTGS